MKNIDKVLKNTNCKKQVEIDWTDVWSREYPILKTYQKRIKLEDYTLKIREMLDDLSKEYGCSELDSMLILKDILYHEWKNNNK